MFLPSSLSCQPFSVLADRGAKPLTNDQICDLITAKVAQFRLSREYALFKQKDSLLQLESSTLPSSFVSLPQTSTSNKDKGHKQSPNKTAFLLGAVTVGKSPEEDSWRTAKSSSESEKKEDSRILSDVAAACKKKDERSPVVTAIISGAPCDELIKESSLTVSGSASQKEKFQLDGNKTLDDKDGETEVGQQEKGDAVKEGRVAATSKLSTTKYESSTDQRGSHFTFKKQSVNYMPTLSTGKTQIVGAGSQSSHQQNLTKQFQQTKRNHPAQRNAERIPSFPILIDPQYDNISDVEEPSGLTKRFLRLKQYEDISEDENHYRRTLAVEMRSTSPALSKASSKTLEIVQNVDSPKTPTQDEIPEIRFPCSVEVAADSEHDLYGERDLAGQAKSFFVEVNNQSDEESEDEWEVIPVSILDFKFEPVEKQPASGNVVHGDGAHEHQVDHGGMSARQSCALKPVPASAFSKMAVFDTPDDQEQAVRFGQLTFVVLSCGSSKAKLPETKLGSEREDSCETDNSSTYSSGPECSYMTVPKELFNSLSPAQRKTDRCVPENREDVQMHPVLEKFQSRIPPDESIINLLDSDEDNDNHCETKAKKLSSQTDENWHDPSSTLRMAFPENVDGESEECVLVEDEVSKENDESVVIILSDSEDEGRENYNLANKSFTADSVDCGRAGYSGQERNTTTPEVQRAHRSKPDDKNKKSSWPKVSSQQSDGILEDLTREVVSSEAEDGDDFPYEGGNVLVPQRKKQKTYFCNPRPSSDTDTPVSSSIIPRMLVRESKSDDSVTLVREPRDPSQDPGEALPMERSSLKEKWHFFMSECAGKPASISSRTTDSNWSSSRRIMHASQSHSNNPMALDHPFNSTRFPPPSTSVKSMQATSHARNKVFSDWKRQHVPLRREKKNKRTKGFRRPR